MAKRKSSRGDGSIHKRKDGRWEGRYVIGRNEKGLPKQKMYWLRPNGSVRKNSRRCGTASGVRNWSAPRRI